MNKKFLSKLFLFSKSFLLLDLSLFNIMLIVSSIILLYLFHCFAHKWQSFGTMLFAILYSCNLLGQTNNNTDSANNLLNTNTYKVNNHYKKDSLKKNRLVTFHGTIITEAQAATQAYQYQQVPQNYIRWTIQPEITLFGLPFKSVINLSTEQGRVNYNQNRFSLSLDVNQFQKSLTNRLKERVKGNVSNVLVALKCL